MKKVRVVTYNSISQEAAVMEIDHTDTSALGLNVIAVVDGTGCGPNDPRCIVCAALRRRIKAHIGASQAAV